MFRFVWLIQLKAYQHLMGYFMPKFDLLIVKEKKKRNRRDRETETEKRESEK